MKRYKLLNNSLGWLMFVIAAVTYLLTLEPTASFWDCPEFISQGYKLEIGHPPGNPIFMLAARFFVNFAPGPEYVAVAVNTMSALLSAATILLLFWTITHLVKKLVVNDSATGVTPLQMLVIFASGACGALMYTWSDTFWFSAVEGEVYAFSSFCTALVFWLILKWEDCADMPHSDRYLVLIAYIIGISIAVHLLNLLCIPAIVLVFYYRKFKNTNAKGSMLALLVSFVIVGLILYGLVPGFIEMAQYCELLCVNVLHRGYNSGALIYALLTLGVMIWAVTELYRQSNARRIKLSFFLTVFLSGIPFIGDNAAVPVILSCALLFYLFVWLKKIPVRVFNVIVLSILSIFVGYSSYALLLIRSTANTPMNQNAPNNVFSLSSYLNREQYGDRPLFYGATFNSGIVYKVDAAGVPRAIRHDGHKLYGKAVKKSADEPDKYVVTGTKYNYEMTPELNMLFPRMYEGRYANEYKAWTGMTGQPVQATIYVDEQGNPIPSGTQTKIKPTMLENLRFFINYQLNHMYWRYFLWNFAGRQNDLAGNGEITHGNWISGIPLIDNARLGPQELLPDDLGKDNKGHNVFFMLPLIMGILGICWQAFTSKRGIEQFWVVAFLFFMTGIAIVIYLNQTPNPPRERDYAFAGSFYAYAIWVGMGVAAIWRGLLAIDGNKKESSSKSKAYAIVAAIVGLIIPIQVVSQTWDDHDRSGRYAARDFGMNYLSSLDKDAIIFTNGDNDTFPLWYAQEVEGYRTDVRVVNLSYLTTDWYVDQQRLPSYEAAAIDMQAVPADYAHDALQFAYLINPDTTRVNALSALKDLYRPDSKNTTFNLREIRYPNMYIPLNREDMIKQGRITTQQSPDMSPVLPLNMSEDPEGGLRLSKTMAIDMMATNATNGWKRPFYFAMTVPDEYYLGLSPYMQLTGMAYEVTGLKNAGGGTAVNTEKAYQNIKNFRWGGLDKPGASDNIYLDETVRRMVTSTRSAMIDLATQLYNEGVTTEVYFIEDSASLTPEQRVQAKELINQKYSRAEEILDLMIEKLPAKASPLGPIIAIQTADLYSRLAEVSDSESVRKKATELLLSEINLYKGYMLYIQSLTPQQFGMLSHTDRSIYDSFFIQLVQLYGVVAGNEDFTKLVTDLQAEGVNFARYVKADNDGNDSGQQ